MPNPELGCRTEQWGRGGIKEWAQYLNCGLQCRVRGGGRNLFVEMVGQRKPMHTLFDKGGIVSKKHSGKQNDADAVFVVAASNRSPMRIIILTVESKRRIMHLFFCPCTIPIIFGLKCLAQLHLHIRYMTANIESLQ